MKNYKYRQILNFGAPNRHTHPFRDQGNFGMWEHGRFHTDWHRYWCGPWNLFILSIMGI